MQEIDLSRLDLNLLLVFEALMRERHVGRAAEALHLTQPAVSHALGRLRLAFDDPLFVRHARGVRPTARADALRDVISPALSLLRSGLGRQAPFDPSGVERQINLGASDYVGLILMPGLLASLRSAAPRISLRILPTTRDSVLSELRRREIDFAIGRTSSAPRGLRIRPLFSERLVLIARRGHPGLAQLLTPDAFAGLSHLLVAPGGEAFGMVDDALRAAGLSRRIAFVTPHFLAAPFIVGASDLIAVMAERIARRLAEPAGVQIFELPISLPPWTVGLARLDEAVDDPAVQWLEEVIVSAAATV